MFSAKKSKFKSAFFPAESVSTVASSMHINGDVEASHDMRIDGTIAGHVFCKGRVVLGDTGRIEGDLHAENADVFGRVNGNIYTKELLCLKSKSLVNGDISVGRLDIEPEAEFNGKCTMHHEKEKAAPAKIQATTKQPVVIGEDY